MFFQQKGRRIIMISMKNKQEIIKLLRTEELSESEISLRTGFSRNTIRRYLKQYARTQDQLALGETESEHLFLFTPPHYSVSNRPKRRLNTTIEDVINACLQENAEKRSSNRWKQRMLKCDIYDLLREQNHIISYSSVCNYIRSIESKTKESFIKQTYQPGHSCEFDWGDVKLCIDGVWRKFNIAVFTLPYSNGRKAYLFQRQDTLAFMESHIRFFEEIQGAPLQMTYDNIRVAVAEFVGNTEKRPTVALTNMETYYGFNHRFCNAQKGNEKGHVERSVEVVRRKAFCRVDSFKTLEEAYEALSLACDKLNNQIAKNSTCSVMERMQEELQLLNPYKGKMGCYEMKTLLVDKWSTVTLHTSHYSVPDHLVGKVIDVKLYSDKLVMYNIKQIVATHERLYASRWSINIEHYLLTLLRKPGAIADSLALKQAPEIIKSIYQRYFRANGKGFVDLLLFCKERNIAYTALNDACQQAKTKGIIEITEAHIKVILTNKSANEEPIEHITASEIQIQSIALLDQATALMNLSQIQQSN